MITLSGLLIDNPGYELRTGDRELTPAGED